MWQQRLLMLEAEQGALYATFLNRLEDRAGQHRDTIDGVVVSHPRA
jgi:hypothetical protein